MFEYGQDFEYVTQQNASLGKETRVEYQIIETDGNLKRFYTPKSRQRQKPYRSIVFKRFVYICEAGCMHGEGFFGQTRLIRKSSKDRPLLTYHQFWSQRSPCFESFRFAKFLSSFVKSGLYELEVSRYKKLKQVNRLRKLEGSKKRGWSNGSLFSYAFLDALAKERAEIENVEEPMKIVALKGFFGQTMLVHKSANDHSLLTYHEFWFQDEPSFESFRYAKFLSSFVKSGLYELEVSRYKRMKQVERLTRLEGLKKKGWSNGSLFSYAFLDALAKERAEIENVEEPMKIVALNGTFIFGGMLLIVALFFFVIELRIFYSIFSALQRLWSRICLFPVLNRQGLVVSCNWICNVTLVTKCFIEN
ncbi:unnamed protein product [Orchesella dallaii]|uniref:Uncharacterized protein n=1 Tax=Orchesella dallaii TaxID=48710 RepID=A0ABP1RGP4_9HEXA